MPELAPAQWTPALYRDLLAHLNTLAEPDFADFSRRLTPTALPLLGVRVPALRSLAKEIARGGDWRGWLAFAGQSSFEEVLLHGLVIGLAKTTPAERMPLLAGYLPQIDNWAVNDVVASTVKEAARQRGLYWEFLLPCLDSPREFEVRFAVTMLMDHFICSEYIGRLLPLFDSIHREEYYIRMAVAWALSVCYVKYPEPTMALLRQSTLDDFTYNKALQKICESRRATDAQKAVIRSMKRK